jgi:small GTP-binding protein
VQEGERVVFEVIPKKGDTEVTLLYDVLKSEGWECEGDKLTMTFPKEAISKKNIEGLKAVHSVLAKMKYLLKAAKIDYDLLVVSETAESEKEEKETVVKLKVGLVGDSEVGKTSLIRRFVLDQFDDRYVKTIGAKVSKKEMNLPLSKEKRLRVDMIVWDILGEKSIADLYIESHFKGMQGILAICDLTRTETLNSVDGWASSVFHVTGKVPTYILANKVDLQGQFKVHKQDVAKCSKNLGIPYIFTSAKTGENVERAFHELAQRILFGKDWKRVAAR